MPIARVAVETPIPTLDRLFDYVVPEILQDSARVGVRVRVPFGRAAKPLDGFIVELVHETDSKSELSEIFEVVSSIPVLPARVYQLCRAVADRQASTLYDVLKLAVPKRAPRAESQWLASERVSAPTVDVQINFASKVSDCPRQGALLAEPRVIEVSVNGESISMQAWIAQALHFATQQLEVGNSVQVVAPDFRDHARFFEAAKQAGLSDYVVQIGADQTPSNKYLAALRCLDSQPVIAIGSRSAIFSPVSNLGLIIVFDDADESLFEQASPYISTRDVALISQQQAECKIAFISNSRSTEVERLVEIGYLVEASSNFAPPRIAVTDTPARLDSTAMQAIRQSLSAGGSVLIQVATTGFSSSLFCKGCESRATCASCNGPLFLDTNRKVRCRWCNAFNLSVKCGECHSSDFRQGAAGSTRTVEEFGKSFPGVAIVESTHEKLVSDLPVAKRIVVATCGAEPLVFGGYSCVVLLDAKNLLSRDSLRATENAVRAWSNAVALGGQGSRAVLVGVSGQLGKNFALWNQRQIASEELASRRALGFPPALRLASVTGIPTQLAAIVEGLAAEVQIQHPGSKTIDILGPTQVEDSHRYLIRYEYSVGATLARLLKARAIVVSAGSTVINQKSGRVSRSVRIKMDEPQVI